MRWFLGDKPNLVMKRIPFLVSQIVALSLALPSLAEEATVTIQREGRSATLLVDGKPFEVKGVGGEGALELLRDSGGNTVRTWGIGETTPEMLDEAHRLGLKVALGYWIGHERHGFSYTDWGSVTGQADALFAAVRKFKDHPAVLLWGIGNEMEGFESTSNPAIYTQIEYLAKKVKEIDPNHPVMTVTAEIGKRQIEGLNRFCPSVDIHGINSYGGVVSLPKRYKEGGGVKPYVITEFGPAGTWETEPNRWGMPDELSSTEKAKYYRRAYETVHADPLCLGSFAFMWGSKQEASATWFGLLLPSGEKLAGVDELTQLWSGKPAENLCPVIQSIALQGPNQLLDQGAIIEVKLEASDPEGKELKVTWVLTEDWKETAEGGDERPAPPTYSEAILPESTASHARIQIPQNGGTFRVYAYVVDPAGGAATANVSIKVTGGRELISAKKLPLPLTVAGAEGAGPWVPSGWMGDTEKLTLEELSTENPKVGEHCIKLDFTADSGWAGVVWQHPSGDWGDAPGGIDATGAEVLSFWAKGKEGGEKLTVGIGVIGADKPYHDTVKESLDLTLTSEWVQHEIVLKGKDLSRIKSGLFFSTASNGKPYTFYLDEVVIK